MPPALETTYLGLPLAHPIVASAGPWSHGREGLRHIADSGASALVMHSLFEEEITTRSHLADHYLDFGTNSFGEALSYVPALTDYGTGPGQYLELIAAAKSILSIPVIGSLNGTTPGGWRKFARQIEDAGADALELNIYHIATDPSVSGATIETIYTDAVHTVAAEIEIPLAVKISPFLSAPAHMARQLVEAGASGIVLFNRFYQPDFDLDELAATPKLTLSEPGDMRLPLRWTAILFARIAADLAITSGVHSAEDVLKGLLAGASVTMMTSHLLQHGPAALPPMLDAIRSWMEEREYSSVNQLRGSLSHVHSSDPDAFERANYRATLSSYRNDPSLGHW